MRRGLLRIRNASSLVIASHDGKSLDAGTLNAVKAASKVCVLVVVGGDSIFYTGTQ